MNVWVIIQSCWDGEKTVDKTIKIIKTQDRANDFCYRMNRNTSDDPYGTVYYSVMMELED